MNCRPSQILLIILLATFSVSIFSQVKPQPNKKNGKATKSKIITRGKIIKCDFLSKEIDLNIEKLPTNYLGNDLQAITNEVIKKGRFLKDEFETTIQFNERVKNEKNKTLVGGLNYNNLLAFSDNNSVIFKYNADDQKLTIDLFIWRSLLLPFSCQPPKSGINLAFYRKGNLDSMYNLAKDIPLDIETAKTVKPNLRILYIGKLDDSIGEFYTFPSVYQKFVSNIRYREFDFVANRDLAQAGFNAAERELKRATALLEQGEIPRSIYDRAQDRFEIAKSNLTKAENNLSQAKADFDLDLAHTRASVKNEKETINLLLKEIWIYDISTGKILLKHKIE